MPELPEVETTVKGLNQKVLGGTFIDVWSDWKKTVKKPSDFEQFKKGIQGKRINAIYRRAKNIIFDLSGGNSLLVHQKMTGHLLVGHWKLKDNIWTPSKEGPLNDPYNRFLHTMFFLKNGEMMALSDARKFAKIELWDTEALLNSKEFKSIGPEPLETHFTFKKCKAAFANKKGKIKQVMMVPEVIAGIGNIYSSEALWQAKIHPEKNVADLDDKELKALYHAIQKVLRAGVNLGGDSFSDYRKVDGTKGDFDDERQVYQREKQKCHRCGTLIKRIKVAARSAFFCPKCQTV